MTKVYPFGQPDKTKNATNTPAQATEENTKATHTHQETPQATGETTGAKAPKGYSQDAWDEAERAWRNKNGGNGISDEAKETQIKEVLRQQGESVEQTRKWEGKE